MAPKQTISWHRERRSARRYDLSLPITIRSVLLHEAGSLNARTRDISSQGIYFTIEREFAPGSELTFKLILPVELTRATEVFVRGSGKVVRVEKKKEDGIEFIGTVVVIEKFDIVRADPPVPESFTG